MTFVATADLLTTSEIEISELGLTNYNYELKLETILKKAWKYLQFSLRARNTRSLGTDHKRSLYQESVRQATVKIIEKKIVKT